MTQTLINVVWLLVTFVGVLMVGAVGHGLFMLLPSSIRTKIEQFHMEE